MKTGMFSRLQNEIDAREKAAGLSVADILELPDNLRRLVNWLMREGGVGLPQLVAHFGQDEATLRSHLTQLQEKGFIRELSLKGEPRFWVRLAPKKKRALPADLWRALGDALEAAGE